MDRLTPVASGGFAAAADDDDVDRRLLFPKSDPRLSNKKLPNDDRDGDDDGGVAMALLSLKGGDP